MITNAAPTDLPGSQLITKPRDGNYNPKNVRVDLETIEKTLRVLPVREDSNNPFSPATRSPKVVAT